MRKPLREFSVYPAWRSAFLWDKTRLSRLLKVHPIPALGEIAWAQRADMKWVPGKMPHVEYIQWKEADYHPYLWTKYDSHFGGRPDYRLWRLILRSNQLSPLCSKWSISNSIDRALESVDEIIVWGAFSVIAGFLTSRRLPPGLLTKPHDRAAIAIRCEQRLLNGIAPVRHGSRGSALVKALMWGAIQQVKRDVDVVVTQEDATDFYDRLEASLRDADPNWQPGKTLRVGDGLRKEAASGRVIAPFDPVDIQLRVAALLNMAKMISRSSALSTEEESDRLLMRSAMLALTSWRFMRAIRIGEEQFLLNHPTYIAELDMNDLLRSEFRSLTTLSETLRNAGKTRYGCSMCVALTSFAS